MLNGYRNTVYYILGNEKNRPYFEFITVAGQSRDTITSFECWYNSQRRHRTHRQAEVEVPPTELSEPSCLPAKNVTQPVLPMADKLLYLVEDLQAVLSIGRKAAYRLIQSGEVLAVEVGNAYLISAAEFQRITGRRPNKGHDHTEG